MPLFTPNHEAVTKLLIASTDLADSAFHFSNALRAIGEAAHIAAEGSGLAVSCSLLKCLGEMSVLSSEITTLRTELHKLAAIHYPEALTEEI